MAAAVESCEGAGASNAPKPYGTAFSSGFLPWLQSGSLSDVTVVVVTEDDTPNPTQPPAPSTALQPLPAAPASPPPSQPSPSSPASPQGQTFHLHGLLLARHSAFFAAALGQAHFADSAARRIVLRLDPATLPAWPALLHYLYTDRVLLDGANVLPLLALARQLLVPELDGYCLDYVGGRLRPGNCLAHLRAAVRFSLHDLHATCVELAARSEWPTWGSREAPGSRQAAGVCTWGGWVKAVREAGGMQ